MTWGHLEQEFEIIDAQRIVAWVESSSEREQWIEIVTTLADNITTDECDHTTQMYWVRYEFEQLVYASMKLTADKNKFFRAMHRVYRWYADGTYLRPWERSREFHWLKMPVEKE